MIDRIRDFFRDEHIGITIPVGVTLGIVLAELLRWFFAGMIVPILNATALGDDDEVRGFGIGLDFTVGDIKFEYTQVLNYLFVLGVLGLIVWWLFVSSVAGGELEPDDEDRRDCPECKSSILADARRCAFCTAQVTPVLEPAEPDPGATN